MAAQPKPWERMRNLLSKPGLEFSTRSAQAVALSIIFGSPLSTVAMLFCLMHQSSPRPVRCVGGVNSFRGIGLLIFSYRGHSWPKPFSPQGDLILTKSALRCLPPRALTADPHRAHPRLVPKKTSGGYHKSNHTDNPNPKTTILVDVDRLSAVVSPTAR